MRVMGLDVGTKTVGVALSDELGWTAQGLETIKIDEEKGQLGYARVQEIVEQNNVDTIIVGLPKHMNGSVGERGEACINYGEELKNRLSLPVIMWDERLSTMAAEKLLITADVSRKKRKKVIDKLAAVVILQGYLDSKKF